MIPLWPYQKLVFKSPLSREEITRRLTREVSDRQWSVGLFEKRRELFEGTISDEGFKISRIIRYRNSFRPVIQGQFSPSVKGMRVEVTLRLHGAMLAFSIVWLSIVGMGLAAGAARVLSTGQVGAQMLGPLAALVFFYLLVTLGFGFEARKASKLLSGVFEAEGLNPKDADNWTV
jgi:hypothetical protein